MSQAMDSRWRAFQVFGALSLGTLTVSVVSLRWSLPAEAREFVLWELRAPRVAIALLAGSTLALVGAAFQKLFRNPLAAPSTLGTMGGATLGALLALTLGSTGVGFLAAASVFAFVGAALASAVVMAVAAKGRSRLEEVLLAGIAVTLAASALSQAVYAFTDANKAFAATMWSLGQLPQVGFDRVRVALWPTLACTALLLRRARALEVLLLGEEWARSVGVNTRRVRLEVLGASCLGVGVVVALCGPIAFVGLLVPHLARPLVRGRSGWLLPASGLLGGGFLVFADLLARVLLPGRELPVGAVTAALGAPALLWLVGRGRRDA